MARPRKQGLDYFPFDVDFFQDEKIVAIGGQFGLKGELAAIKLLCAVYRNGYFAVWSEMLQAKLLRELPGVSPGLLTQIITCLVRWGFFNEALFNSAKVLTSAGIQRRYFEVARKRNMERDLPYILENDKVLTNISSAETTPKTGFLPRKLGKVKKIEENTTDVVQKKIVSAEETISSVDDEIKILRSERAWVETTCMLHHIDAQCIDDWLEQFSMQCKADGKLRHDNITDAKRHFNNWLRIKLQTKNEDNERRGKDGRRAHLLRTEEAETKQYGSSF